MEPVSENKKLYGPLGIYQGIFSLEDNKIIKYAPGTNSHLEKVDKEQFVSNIKETVVELLK